MIPIHIIIYLWNLLAFCSGIPTPLISIVLRMSITFENDNNVIVYTLEKVIVYARANQYIFLAQCCWWISLLLKLQEGLVIHIDNLRIRADIGVIMVPGTARNISEGSGNTIATNNIHPDRLFGIQDTGKRSSTPEDEAPSISEDQFHNPILDNFKVFLEQSKAERKQVACKSLQASRVVKRKAN